MDASGIDFLSNPISQYKSIPETPAHYHFEIRALAGKRGYPILTDISSLTIMVGITQLAAIFTIFIKFCISGVTKDAFWVRLDDRNLGDVSTLIKTITAPFLVRRVSMLSKCQG